VIGMAEGLELGLMERGVLGGSRESAMLESSSQAI